MRTHSRWVAMSVRCLLVVGGGCTLNSDLLVGLAAWLQRHFPDIAIA